jgi:hypothetical protein
MNAALISDIRKLAVSDARPSVILRRILADKHHRDMSRLWLFKELREVFAIDLRDVLPVGGWNYWDGEGYGDDELDEVLKGKLKPKDAGGEDSSSEAA